MIDLATQHGGDFLRIESALQEQDYTPDLIPFVDDTILANVTQLTAGKVMRLKKLCINITRRRWAFINQILSRFVYISNVYPEFSIHPFAISAVMSCIFCKCLGFVST
jgi:hypothetical protein